MSAIRDVMTRDVESLTPTSTAMEAARRMIALSVGSMPVCENERIVGVVTDRELTGGIAAERRDPATTLVRDLMSRDVACCIEDRNLMDAAKTMAKSHSRRVYVVDGEGRLKGIVSLGTVARTAGDQVAGRVVRSLSKRRTRSGPRRAARTRA